MERDVEKCPTTDIMRYVEVLQLRAIVTPVAKVLIQEAMLKP